MMPIRHARRIWLAPTILALLTMFGLLAALLGEGIWQPAAWLSLTVPVLVLCKFAFMRRDPAP